MFRSVFTSLGLSVLTSFSLMAQSYHLEFASADNNGVIYEAEGVLVDDQGTLATVAIVGANPLKATLKGKDGAAKALKLIGHDSVSRMTLVALPEGWKDDVKPVKEIGSSLKMAPADQLQYDKKSDEVQSRFICRDKRYQGTVLPLSLMRVHHAKEGVLPGTPLFDGEGKLVGFTHQMIADERCSSYALPVEVLEHLIAVRKIQPDAEFGFMKRCWVGIAMDALVDAPVITGIRPESPARAAGLQKGDVVLSIGGNEVNDYADVVNAMYFLVPGKEVTIKVLRGMKVVETKITPEIDPLLK